MKRRSKAVLMGYAETDTEAKALLGEFTHALSEFGWIERQNLRMDVRWAPAKTDLMRTYAKELVSLQPDLILTDSTPVTAAVKRETTTIPMPKTRNNRRTAGACPCVRSSGQLASNR